MKRTIWLAVILVLSACSPVNATSSPSVVPPFDIPTATLAVEISPDVMEVPTQPCGYQWAYQSLPAVSEQLQQALDAAGLDGVTIRAEAFGENCVNADGSVQRFLPMQTDLYFQAMLADLAPETIGSQVELIYAALQHIPIDTLPGPGSASAYLTFEFAAGHENIRFRVQRQQVTAALQAGNHNAELYNALAP